MNSEKTGGVIARVPGALRAKFRRPQGAFGCALAAGLGVWGFFAFRKAKRLADSQETSEE